MDEYGLNLLHGNGYGLPLNDTDIRWGVRFTADESITVDQATTYLISGSGSNIQMALQSDDGSGNPSGIDLAVATIASPAGGDYNTAPLNAPYALTAGSVYHLIYRQAGAGTASIRETSPATVLSHTDAGTPEANYALMYRPTPASSWTAYTTDAVIWGLTNSSTNQGVGQPYAFGQYKPVYADIWQGQSFTFTGWGANNVVDSLSMAVYKGSASSQDDLYVYLIDTTTNAAIWSGKLVDKNAPATTTNADVYSVAVPNIALVDGRKYIIAAEALDATTGGGGYELLGSYAYASAILGENFQEAQGSQYVRAFAVSLPGSFSDMDGATDRTDLYFKLHTTVPEPASLSLLALGAVALGGRRRMR